MDWESQWSNGCFDMFQYVKWHSAYHMWINVVHIIIIYVYIYIYLYVIFPSISTMLVACHCHPLVIKTQPWRITQLKIVYVMCLLKVAFFHCTIRLPEGIPYIHQNPQFGKLFCIKVPVCSSMYLHTILHDTPGIPVIYIYMYIVLYLYTYPSLWFLSLWFLSSPPSSSVATIAKPRMPVWIPCHQAHPMIRILSR